MNRPKLLLLTGTAPGRVHVGRMMMRDLCLMYPPNDLVCFYTDRLGLPESETDPELAPYMMTWHPCPPENGFHTLGAAVNLWTRPLIEWYIERTAVPRLVNRIVRLGREQGCTKVLALLDSPTMMRIAKPVANELGAELLLMVHDPPSYVCTVHHKLSGAPLQRLKTLAGEAISCASRCGVISAAMGERFEECYGAKCVVMVSASRRAVEVGERRCGLNNPIQIGFAGSLYAEDSWRCLVEALESHRWVIRGHGVVLNVLGANLPPHVAQSHREVNVLGWHDYEETVRLLSAMDVAFLPYSFSSQFREFTQLSFPNKLSTYLAAHLPVLYNGPVPSAAAGFISRFGVGCVCAEPDPGAVFDALEELLFSDGQYDRMRSACARAYERELSPGVLRSNVAALLGVAEELLIG